MAYASTFDFQCEYEHPELGTLYVSAVGGITKYIPATMYRSNGDPGDPEEGGDCEYDELIVTDENETELDFDQVIDDYDWLDEHARCNAVSDDDRYDEDMYDDDGFFD